MKLTSAKVSEAPNMTQLLGSFSLEVDSFESCIESASEHDVHPTDGRGLPFDGAGILDRQVRPANELGELLAGHQAHSAELGDEDGLRTELAHHV